MIHEENKTKQTSRSIFTNHKHNNRQVSKSLNKTKSASAKVP